MGPALLLLAAACAGDPGAQPLEPAAESSPPEPSGLTRHGRPGYRPAVQPLDSPVRSARARRWDSERLWGPHVDWEPAVAADPGSSWVYQLTTRYYEPACLGCPDPAIVFRRSADGGRTWEEDRYLPELGRGQGDPQILVTGDGTIYAAYLQDFRPGAVFVKSSDRGESWSEPVAVIGEGPPNWSDRPILAASADGRDVYLAFNASNSWVAVSHDFGDTFEPPVKTNRDRRYWFHSAGVVTVDGEVHFGVADYSEDYSGDSHVGVLSSRDGGATWTTTRLDTSKEPPPCGWARGCYFGFFGPSVAIAADATGALALAYNAGRADREPQRLWVRTSADGTSWTPPQRVSRPARWVQNGFPALAAGPGRGDFRLVWQDDRRTRARGQAREKRWNTFFRRSRDGGLSWGKSVRLSDRGDGSFYKDPRGYRFPYGDYLEIDVDGEGVSHVIWGEGRSFAGNGGTWYTRGGPRR